MSEATFPGPLQPAISEGLQSLSHILCWLRCYEKEPQIQLDCLVHIAMRATVTPTFGIIWLANAATKEPGANSCIFGCLRESLSSRCEACLLPLEWEEKHVGLGPPGNAGLRFDAKYDLKACGFQEEEREREIDRERCREKGREGMRRVYWVNTAMSRRNSEQPESRY